jgi:pheromone shutdown protein TraB
MPVGPDGQPIKLPGWFSMPPLEEVQARLPANCFILKPSAKAISSPSLHPQREVIVIGTAHVSSVSARDVKEAIELLKPDTVFLELCKARSSLLLLNEEETLANYQKPITSKEVVEAVKTGQLMAFFLGLLYRKIVAKLKAIPGAEFRAAYESGKVMGSNVVLGDRPISITLARCWNALSGWERLKFGWGLLNEPLDISEADVERLKNADVLSELVAELSKVHPRLANAILDERDMWLAFALRSCPGRRIVAVVGLGHVAGMQRVWEEDIDMKAISEVPPRRSWRSWLLRNASVVAASYAVYRYSGPLLGLARSYWTG